MGSIQQLLVAVIALGIDSVTAQSTPSAPVAPQFQAPPNVGRGTGQYTDSAHFRIWGTASQAKSTINELEAAYSCFVDGMGYRSTGLSYNDAGNSGPFYKMNVYSKASLGNAAGVMQSDPRTGLSFLQIIASSLTDPKVSVHEWGHALAYHGQTWVNQGNTGAWWETVANFVADTYMTSPMCAEARQQFNQPEGRTIVALAKVIGASHQVLVDGSSGSGNHYEAWPFLAYLTYNPDKYPALGEMTMRELFRQYKKGSNETPLHTVARVSTGASVQKLVGRYWARMAYGDIGHAQIKSAFATSGARYIRPSLDAAGAGTYRVKAARAPKYFGANIIPLKGSGAVSVMVTAPSAFTATLAIKPATGAVRYVDLVDGAGQATLAAGEAASLVVANTPAQLYTYDPFQISGNVARGLSYQVQLTGATV
ncbi:hypothetical protein K402DRAFT_386526 [Aulographum hederae CBS 113979]|uniref:Dockerin type 1 n=1 Tax=Aulographum hederae CBS 113979 TaxID=1176131 RepID=A0A6G1GKB1_9PEZI|nr:hypothetical protein K402DRAFT_386526 [Aulographum hederae CBS 113979]